jgi:hypothetical protein
MRNVSAWAGRRAVPIVATVAMVVPVLAYSLLGHSGLHGGHFAIVSPTDLWSLAASSWAIGHGHFGQIYLPSGALTSPPAFEIAMAPLLLLAHAAGIGVHFGGAAQPVGVWIVLALVSLAFASTFLFAVDAVARHWCLSEPARLVLAVVSALGVANVTGLWGHPEDCMAVAFVLWAALAMARAGTTAAPKAALLLGIGIAFQPLAVLGIAPVLAGLAWRDALRHAWRLVVPSALALVPPLLGEPARTRWVLVHQPFEPRFVSYTPLTHLAPVIGHGVDGGGPTRLVAIVLSAALAVVVCRRRPDLVTALSMTAVAFFLRALLESELNWYYVWPVAAVCLPLCMRRSPTRFVVGTAALMASMVLGNHDEVHHITLWWPALMATLAVMLLSATAPPPQRWFDRPRPRQRSPLPLGP